MRLILLAAFLSVALAGCSSSSAVEKPAADAQPDNVQAPPAEPPVERAENPYCEDVPTGLGAADDTPLGVTGGELLAALLERGTGTAFWIEQRDQSELESEVEAGFDVSVTADERSLRFVESTEVYPENSSGLGIICSNSLSVDGQITLQTDDGRLDLSLPTTFFLSADDVAKRRITFAADLDGATLGPAFRLDDFVDTSLYESVSLSLWGTIEGGALEGEIQGVGTHSDDFSTGASLFTLANFSAE